jgi:hypothetical protein
VARRGRFQSEARRRRFWYVARVVGSGLRPIVGGSGLWPVVVGPGQRPIVGGPGLWPAW